MRKTELAFGISAAAVGLILALLSLFLLLPYSGTVEYSADVIKTYAVVCIVANVIGLAGALLILKNNILGSIIMAASMIIVLFFGFPWQSISAVLYIISFIMAVVPEKMNVHDQV